MISETIRSFLIELNSLLDPEIDIHTLSLKFDSIASQIRSSGKKINAKPLIDDENIVLKHFVLLPNNSQYPISKYLKSDLKIRKNSLSLFYFYKDDFYVNLNVKLDNHLLLYRLIQNFNF